VTAETSDLYRRLLGAADMNAAFSDASLLAAALEFEAALAEAEAECAVIPADAARVIAEVARGFRPDAAALAEAGARAGTLAIPLVGALTGAVKARDAGAAAWVHFGSTSQDLADTALVLMLREAARLLDDDLDRAETACAILEETHRGSVMLSRTLMQPAPPTTFGFRAGGWGAAIGAARAGLRRASVEAVRLQFGGAAGTLGAFGRDGGRVAAAVGRRLGLAVPERPWHTARGELVMFGAAAGVAVGALAKIARDVTLLMQYEIGEVFEPTGEGRGGSSAMPHKRNPSGSMVALAAQTRVPGLVASLLAGMVQELDRGVGGWQGEWLTLPQIFEAAGGAAHAMAEVLEGLDVRPERMRANLDAALGLVYSERVSLRLAGVLGRQEAKDAVAAACKAVAATGRPLAEMLAEDGRVAGALGADGIAELTRPEGYLGLADY
jgi:3-carboxy-cis,cis-muconate cycloisomerase